MVFMKLCSNGWHDFCPPVFFAFFWTAFLSFLSSAQFWSGVEGASTGDLLDALNFFDFHSCWFYLQISSLEPYSPGWSVSDMTICANKANSTILTNWLHLHCSYGPTLWPQLWVGWKYALTSKDESEIVKAPRQLLPFIPTYIRSPVSIVLLSMG